MVRYQKHTARTRTYLLIRLFRLKNGPIWFFFYVVAVTLVFSEAWVQLGMLSILKAREKSCMKLPNGSYSGQILNRMCFSCWTLSSLVVVHCRKAQNMFIASVCPSVCLTVCLSVRLSVCLKPKFGRLKPKFDDDAERGSPPSRTLQTKFGPTSYKRFLRKNGKSLIKWTPNGICFKQFSEKYSNLRKIVFSRVIE